MPTYRAITPVMTMQEVTDAIVSVLESMGNDPLPESHKLSTLSKTLDHVIECTTVLRAKCDEAEGIKRRPGTLLRQIRRVLGYTYL